MPDIRFQVTKELKEAYQKICKEKSINSSQMLRSLIEKFVKENGGIK